MDEIQLLLQSNPHLGYICGEVQKKLTKENTAYRQAMEFFDFTEFEPDKFIDTVVFKEKEKAHNQLFNQMTFDGGQWV